MPNQTRHSRRSAVLDQIRSTRRTRVHPIFYVLIPLALLIGLGLGYLLWGVSRPAAAARATPIQRVSVSTDDDPSIGPENAPVTIIEFSDYQCPYCQVWYQQVFRQLLDSYPDQIRFVYRDLASPGHSEALPSAEAANCAGEQGDYWKFHDALFNQQYGLSRTAYEQYAADLGLDLAAFTSCLDSHRHQEEIQADARDASLVGITGTPTFVINGRIVVGAQAYAKFKALVDEELALIP